MSACAIALPSARKTARAQPADTCRMQIVIRGVAYDVRPVGGTDVRCFRFRRPATPADRRVHGTASYVDHHVAVGEHGPTCDCGDFIFRRDGVDPAGCKHIRVLRALGILA